MTAVLWVGLIVGLSGSGVAIWSLIAHGPTRRAHVDRTVTERFNLLSIRLEQRIKSLERELEQVKRENRALRRHNELLVEQLVGLSVQPVPMPGYGEDG